MNRQRETIYGLRRQLMFEPEHREYLLGENGVAKDLLARSDAELSESAGHARQVGRRHLRGRDRKHLCGRSGKRCGCQFQDDEPRRDRRSDLEKGLGELRGERKDSPATRSLRAYERYIMLNIIDSQWKDHLLSIDQVKQGIGLVGYGQKDPLVEYKKQSFDMFQDMLDRIDTNTTKALFHLEIVSRDEERNANVSNVSNISVPAGKRPAWPSPGRWRRQRRRRHRRDPSHAVHARPAESQTQRTVLLRLGEEIQEMPRCGSGLIRVS